MDPKSDTVLYFDQGRLVCAGQDLPRIPPVLFRLYGDRVECLDMSGNFLVSLQGLDDFSNLRELIVDGNAISENVVLPLLPKLETLSINKNRINNLELFIEKAAKSLPNLRFLSLLGNPACPDQLSDANNDEEDYARYRCFVVHHFSNLEFLDSAPVRRDEMAEAKRRGHLMRIAKPSAPEESAAYSPVFSSDFTPLPRSRRDIGDHQGAYGKCRYRYSGKNSEGNRFIQNNDL